MTLSGPDDTVWSGARRIRCDPAVASTAVCCSCGCSAGLGGRRLVRRPAARLRRVLPVWALRPRPVPLFLACFRPRLPLSPPTGHQVTGLGCQWIGIWMPSSEKVHPADARERGSRGSTHHGSTSSSIGDVPQHVKTNPHLQADWQPKLLPRRPHPGLGGRGGQDRRSSRKGPLSTPWTAHQSEKLQMGWPPLSLDPGL